MNIKQIRIKAENGDLYSIALLAWEYSEGKKVKRSYVKAFFWYTEAIIRGSKDENIFYNIGQMYWKGRGVKRNILKSFIWSYKGAKLGDIDCMIATAWNYLTGSGTELNYQKAEYWYQQALKVNPQCSTALFSIGCMNYYVKKDFTNAYSYFFNAYNSNRHVRSSYMLGRMYAMGIGTVKDISLAKKFLRYASSNGWTPAKRLLCSKYFKTLCSHSE